MKSILIRGFYLFLFLFLFLTGCGPPYENNPEKVFQGKTPDSKTYQEMARTIHFVEIGRQQEGLVIFIHGTPGSWQAFSSYLADTELSEKTKLVAVDRPGFGKSGPGSLVSSLSHQALLLRPLLDKYPDPCGALLVGHSLGAPIAARIAMDFPDLVGGLLLIAPSLDPLLESPRWYNRLADFKMVQWLLPSHLVLANKEVMTLPAELREMLPLWSSVDLPVTVIQGEKDRLVDPANADFAEMMLPGKAKIVRLPDAGHFVLWNRPELIKSELLDLLTRRHCSPEKRS